MKNSLRIGFILAGILILSNLLRAEAEDVSYAGDWTTTDGLVRLSITANDGGSYRIHADEQHVSWNAECNRNNAYLRCSGSGRHKSDRRGMNINSAFRLIDDGTLQYLYARAFSGGERARGAYTLRRKGTPDDIPQPPIVDDTQDDGTDDTNDDTNISFQGCPTGSERVPAYNEGFEKEVLRLVNVERRKHGLPELQWNADLTRAARYHAADMAIEDYFNHTSYDRQGNRLISACDTWKRIQAFYASPGAENIAAGSRTPEGVMQQWMNSPGHRANILRRGLTQLGVGLYAADNSKYGYYWVQNFGR